MEKSPEAKKSIARKARNKECRHFNEEGKEAKQK